MEWYTYLQRWEVRGHFLQTDKQKKTIASEETMFPARHCRLLECEMKKCDRHMHAQTHRHRQIAFHLKLTQSQHRDVEE